MKITSPVHAGAPTPAEQKGPFEQGSFLNKVPGESCPGSFGAWLPACFGLGGRPANWPGGLGLSFVK